MVQEKFGLPHSTVLKIRAILDSRSGIEKVTLYGSRAMGSFKLGSDIDLVLTAPDLTHFDLLKIEGEIDDLLLPYKIDLSLMHQIDNASLIDHIRRVGVSFE